jgi:hypothetical protein
MSKCNISYCTKLKSGLSNYCHIHRNKKALHGHPEGRSILKKEYKKESEEVLKFIKAYYPLLSSLRTAEKELYTLLKNPMSISDLELRKAIILLGEHDVKPLAIIKETISIYLFAYRYPAMLEDDIRLTYMMGRCSIRLASQCVGMTWNDKTQKNERVYKPIKGKQCRVLGQFLRKRYAQLITEILYGLKLHHQHTAQKQNKLLRRPFYYLED